MWAIENNTPFSAERLWTRNKDGVHEWVVSVKGTYRILDDASLELEDDQPPPLLLPEYRGDDGVSSLKYDTEVGPLKPTTDIVLNGTAYAPNGRPSPDFLIGLRVGSIAKRIRVLGNRFWKRGALGIEPTLVEPVISLPIVYERAYGGYDQSNPDPKNQKIDLRNPVGVGVIATRAAREGQPLHNFEYPDMNEEKAGPAGFGAIASYWSPRLEYLGTYDDRWEAERKPLLPVDWDPRALLCAPADQRPQQHLRGGEGVELVNLTPDGRLAFRLPKAHFSFLTRIDGRDEYTSSRLSTVVIEPDDRRVTMVWQTSLTCRRDIDYLDETIIEQKEDPLG